MSMLTRLLGFGLFLLFCGCNRFVDVPTKPDDGPPPASIQSLSARYPQAKGIVFSTLVPNQLWQAAFTQQQKRYKGLVDPSQLLISDQLAEGVLPDSLTRLLEPTVVAGGTFSSPRVRDYEMNATNLIYNGRFRYTYADYTWQQQPHTAFWAIIWPITGRPFYNFRLLPFQLAHYQSDKITILPDNIQKSLEQQGLVFTYARITVDGAGKRRYEISAKQPTAPLSEQFWNFTYDDEAQMLAANNPATAQFFKSLDVLPSAAQRYLQRPEMAGFVLGGTVPFGRHTYGSLVTYFFAIEKDKQVWELVFSGDGQLINRSFLTFGSF